ncbi:MAG: hypothetical protein RIS10_704, partial [Pseudomonadota bacterium]
MITYLLRLVTILCFIIAEGCSVGPDYKKPTNAFPNTFKEVKGWKQARPRDIELSDKWWEIFKDPRLNALEEQINIANQSIAQAEAQFRQSQSMVQTATAAYFPIANASASASRFKAVSGETKAVSGVTNLFNTALSAAWEPDLWGSVRRQVESSRANAQASAATLQALRLSTQTTLAQNYFLLRVFDAQIKLLNDTVKTYQKTLTITQNRYAVGMAAKSEIVQAETQLQSAQAQAINIEVQRAQVEHAIAILIGKPPAQVTISVGSLNTFLPAIPVSIPSELLERRPDITIAERQAAAANALIGVAKAAYFPTVNLAANNGQQNNSVSNLMNSASRYWT